MNSTSSLQPAAGKTLPGGLPTTDQRPDADVIIFDGHCRFCQGQVARINRWDTGGRLAYLSLHDAEVPRRFPDLDHEALMQQMVLIDRQGHRHWGAAAFRYLSARLPWLWWLAPFMHIPGTLGLWQALYRQVAKRCYLLGGSGACDSGSCRLP